MLSSRYNPHETESQVYRFWQEKGVLDVDPQKDREHFCIVMPPPNITGILHMGHALNNTIQDILVRYKRLSGRCSLWVPGIDHAGIATQNVVERQLKSEGLTRQSLGREELLKRIWAWKEQYGSTILEQLRRLGASCDWRRTRFTMDEQYSEAVLEVFIKLYEKNLIYRGKYIINWCPRCGTSLSDEESPYKLFKGKLYYIKYPLKDSSGFVVVATTRPETMLGDTAVAVNPRDERYKSLVGKNCLLPLVGRVIPIIVDEGVSLEFGTGAVKITPAHDPLDYQIALRHNLEFINIMTPEANISCGLKDYDGLDRFAARKKIIKDLEAQGLLEKVEDYEYSLPCCYRCDTPIEPRISEQWFVKMKPLAEKAIEVVERGQIRFYPERWKKVYLEWMYNIRDWCISRQIWWGHRIPVWYCKNCREDNPQDGNKGIIVSKTPPLRCPWCGSDKLFQDEDVLDTWFSSWLWPFAVFGWPRFKEPYKKEDLDYFYPTSCLVTAPEILFFWVARMIMAGLEFTGKIPFKDVYIHGTVRDEKGRKMSKSLGNIIDPLEVIDQMGADALRFSLINITSYGQDVFLSPQKFLMGRNFTNKIWNASRLFFILHGENKNFLETPLSLEKIDWNLLSSTDKWMHQKMNTLKREAKYLLDNYNFNEASQKIYHVFWHRFCDWYMEFSKIDIRNNQDSLYLHSKLSFMAKCILEFLILLHPFVPFITERLYQELKTILKDGVPLSLVDCRYPFGGEDLFKEEEETVDALLDTIVQIRNIRQQLNIPASQKHTLWLEDGVEETFLAFRKHLEKLAHIEKISVVPASKPFATVVNKRFKLYASLPLKDSQKEIRRLSQKIEELSRLKENTQKLLLNPNFLEKAPRQEVERRRNRLQELEEEIRILDRIRNALR